MYFDDGVSGLTSKSRVGFNKLINDARNGKIDIILIKSISRFARNTLDTLNTTRELKEKGVKIYFEKEDIWSDNGKCEFMLTLLASIAQEESRSISENVKWGHRKRFQDGKYAIPYAITLGYDKGFIINEEEAKIVRLIYILFLRGYTPHTIGKKLDEMNIKTPENKGHWCASVVRSILKNEKYKGDALLQKNYTVDFLTKKQKVNEGEIPQYYVENNHEAIITSEMFEIVQAEIERRRKLNGKYSGVDILTSKIICGECGGSYGSKVWHSNDKYRKIVYQCNRKYNGDKKCETPILIKEDIENRFINVVNEIIKNKDEIIENLKIVNKTVCDTKELEKQKNELHQNLLEQVEKIQELIEINSRVTQNQEEYQKEYEKLVNEYEFTKAEHKKIESEISSRLAKTETIELFINTIKKQETLLTEFDEIMWGSLLECVKIYAIDNIIFKFRDGTEIKG